MKIAIVGPELSKWKSKEQIKKAKDQILRCLLQNETLSKTVALSEYLHAKFLGEFHETIIAYEKLDKACKDYLKSIVLVSGHCPKGGVDIWAEETADKLGIKKEIYLAETEQWPDSISHQIEIGIGYKPENPSKVRLKGYRCSSILYSL